MKKKKNEEYKESQIKTMNIFFGFTFFIKNYILLKNIVSKKVVYIPSHFIYSFNALQDIWNAVMMHQSSLYINIIIIIYINRLQQSRFS